MATAPALRWLNIDQYLTSTLRAKPVFLAFDRSLKSPEHGHDLPSVLLASEVQHVLARHFVPLFDRTTMHPELFNLLMAMHRIMELPFEPVLLAVTTPLLLPTELLTMRTRSGREITPADLADRLTQAICARPNPAVARDEMLRKARWSRLITDFSRHTSEDDNDSISKSFDQLNGDLDVLRGNIQRITLVRVCYLKETEAGLETNYARLNYRYLWLGLLTLVLRTCSSKQPITRRLLQMNLQRILTSDLYDLTDGGVFQGTRFSWRGRFPWKLLAEQAEFIVLLTEYVQAYPDDHFRSIIQHTWQCCWTQFFSPTTGMFVNCVVYGEGAPPGTIYSYTTAAQHLSDNERSILLANTNLEELRERPDYADHLRFIRTDLGQDEFAATAAGVRKAGGVPPFPNTLTDAPLMASNAQMVVALIQSAALFDDPPFATSAKDLLERLWNGFDASTGRIASCFEGGMWQGVGTLLDYACLTQALLEMYDFTLDLVYMQRARSVHEATINRFWDEQAQTFRVFSYLHTLTGLSASRGRSFISGAAVALTNHVRLRQLQNQDVLQYIVAAYSIHRCGLAGTNVDAEYTALNQFLSWSVSRRPVLILHFWGDHNQRIDLARRSFRLPRNCRPAIISICAEQDAQYWPQWQQIASAKNCAYLHWSDRQGTQMAHIEDIERCFQQLAEEYETARIHFSQLGGA